jgi:hypothetical protein
MATYLSKNPSIDQGTAVTMIIQNLNTTIANIQTIYNTDEINTVGQVNATGNVVADYFFGNGAFLSGIAQAALPSTAAIDIVGNVRAPGNIVVSGQVNATGNVAANYFIGNGALLSGISQSSLPSTGAIDIVGNVRAPGNIVVSGQVNATGNVVANYLIGNGSQLTGLTTFTLPPVANIDIVGNVIGEYANISNLILTSTFVALGQEAGLENQQTTGVAIGGAAGSINQGNATVAIGFWSARNNQADFGVGIGSYAGSYFQGNRSVAVGAEAGNQLQGDETVAIGSLAGSIDQKRYAVAVGASAGFSNQGNNAVAIGARAGETDQGANSIVINATGNLLTTSSADVFIVKPIRGSANITNQLMYNQNSGEITYNTSGNVSANYFIGNGSLLTGLATFTLPPVANIDIAGNVIGTYANVSSIVASSGNIGNVTVAGGNITASGQINVLGNIIAPFFIGDGSQLTGIAASLPGVLSEDILGNSIGTYANVSFVFAAVGNVGNVTFAGGNISASGQINALGNIVAPFFVGNGSLLTGIAAALPGVIAEDIRGNVIGTYANVSSVISTVGNIGNVILTNGNVTAGNLSGQSIFANLITFGVNANVGKMTGVYSVAMNGNDSTADGSDIKPFLTIQAAHDRALTEYPPTPGGAIAKQVEIRVAAGTFESPVTITRYNTVIRGAGSLFGRGTYTSIGQVSVNCANATSLNNSVCLDRVFCLNGVTNTGTGVYTLTIDSCYLTASNASLLTSENDKSAVYVNDTFLSASLAGGNTYVRAIGNSLNFYDCTIQAPTGVASGGRLIDVGGNCAITLERCFVNALSSTNAVIKATSSVPSALSGFKINFTNSYLQNLGGPGVDFGTTNTAGSFIRNTNAIVPGASLFVGNGTAYYNQLIILPSTSNTKASTVTVLPYTLF